MAASVRMFPAQLAAAGANAFVAGSAVFKGGTMESYKANISAIRNAAAAARGEMRSSAYAALPGPCSNSASNASIRAASAGSFHSSAWAG